MIISSYTQTLIDALSAKATEQADPEQVVAELTAALNSPPEELFNVIALVIQAHKEGQK